MLKFIHSETRRPEKMNLTFYQVRYKVTNMTQMNVYETKRHFSALLRHVQEGETFIILSRNRPVAELRPVPKRPQKKRPFGLATKKIKISDHFNDPLPESLLNAFEGQ